jgi:hypothetical protein
VGDEVQKKVLWQVVIMVDIIIPSRLSVEEQFGKSSRAAKWLSISLGQECKEELFVIVRRAELGTDIHLIAGSNFRQHFLRSGPSGRGQTRTKVVIGSEESDRLRSRCKWSQGRGLRDNSRSSLCDR